MRSYSELKGLANTIKDEILLQYKNRNGFRDDEKGTEGLITSSAGLVSLLLLKNGFENDLTFQDDDLNIIIQGIQDLISYVQENGYDATPYLTPEKTKDYFKPNKGYHYYDSVSWMLSLLIQVWNADKLESNRIIPVEYRDTIKSAIKDALKIICNGAVETGGWGFTNNCDKADLYYSYAISESLADFADYVLGESLSEGIGSEDNELKSFLTNELIDEVNNCRKNTANWLVDTYIRKPKNKLGDVLINPDDPTGEKFKTLPNEKIFPLLYYTYFVIDMLIINKADVFFVEDKELIVRAIEHSIYLSRIYFDKARTNLEWWESYDSELLITFQNHPKLLDSKNISRKDIKEPGLVPLSIRCNILYSFYISKGQDTKIDELFDVLLEEKNENNESHRLWDTLGYNILLTERAVEGLVDYADFISEFQTDPAPNKVQKNIEYQSTPKSLDEVLRALVAYEVKSYFETQNPAKELSTNYGLTKDGLIELLSEVFTDMELLINPQKINELSAKDISSIKFFSKKYAGWLQNILYAELRNCDEDGDKDQIIYDNLRRQGGVFNIIGQQLKEKNQHPNKFELLISYIIEDTMRKH